MRFTFGAKMDESGFSFRKFEAILIDQASEGEERYKQIEMITLFSRYHIVGENIGHYSSKININCIFAIFTLSTLSFYIHFGSCLFQQFS